MFVSNGKVLISVALTELYPSCGTREGKLSGPKNSRIKNKVLPSRGEREGPWKKLGLDVVFFSVCNVHTDGGGDGYTL